MDKFKHFLKYMLDQNVARHARALSFATILSIVPIITIFIGFVGASSNFFNITNEINALLNSHVFPQVISDTFNQYFKLFSEQAYHLKFVGIVFFIISILFLFSDMETSFSDLLSDTEKNEKGKAKGAIRNKVRSIFLLFFAPIFVFLLIGIFNWFTGLNVFIIGKILNTLTQHQTIVKISLLIFLWLWFSFLFYLLPRNKIMPKNIFIGASVATVLFLLSQVLFSYYLSRFDSYKLVYGVFSIIPVFFLWIYLNWQITLYSLLVAHYLDDILVLPFKKEKTQDQEP